MAPATANRAQPDRFFIDGEWVKPSHDRAIDVTCPSTEEVFVSVAEAQAPDMERAVAAAREAFDRGPWPRMSHAARAEYLNALGKELKARVDDLANAWTSEMGV